jgi:hypothetical protein
MTNADRGAFARHLERLTQAFRAQGGQSLHEAYWLGLVSLDIDSVGIAVDRAIAQCERMPSVAELRRLGARQTGDQIAARTDATMASKYRCALHRERPGQAQVDYNWWCDCCRRHGDQDYARTAKQLTEINEWAAEWRAGSRARWTEKQPRIVTGSPGRDWTSEYTPPEIETWIPTSGA